MSDEHVSPAIPAEYRHHDPDNMSDEEVAVLEKLARKKRAEAISIGDFTFFSMVVQQGFEFVFYDSYKLESGHYFWITDKHAKAIAEALAPSLKSFGLVLTTFEGEGFKVMAEHVADDVKFDEVFIKHTSADEVTLKEAAGLAAFITKVGAEVLHLWAGEYDDGALDAFCDAINAADNKTLHELDICDVNLPEPDDQIHLPRLDSLLKRNAAR